MSNVSLVIYGVAALWGVQMLLTFMVQHRRRTLVRLQREEIARREGEVPPNEAEATPAPAKVAAAKPQVAAAVK